MNELLKIQQSLMKKLSKTWTLSKQQLFTKAKYTNFNKATNLEANKKVWQKQKIKASSGSILRPQIYTATVFNYSNDTEDARFY